MANQEHLELFHQGATVWNRWRKEHPQIKPDLSRLGRSEAPFGEHNYFDTEEFGGIRYSETDLRGFNLSKVDLRESNLHNNWNMKLNGTIFDEANLRNADLGGNDLISVSFRQARLIDANFAYSKLYHADLSHSDLENVNFRNADLSKAYLLSANLTNALLLATNLSDTDLHYARLDRTVFGDVDLSSVKGLETVEHKGPSYIDILSIYRSKGQIPEDFLRNAGIPDSFITFAHSLVTSPIDYFTCFISYSSKDQDFAERLHTDLQRKGVRCWFAPEDMNVGDKIRTRIEESIRLYDKLLIVLSEHSIASNWVAYEVERALNKEPEGIPNVLFPIRLDDAVMESKAGWAVDIKRTRHIGDFTHWKNHDDYQKAFNRLLRALKSETSRRL